MEVFPSEWLHACEVGKQLRNLVWATSKHDVYLMHSYSVMHWSSMTRKGTEVLSVAGPLVPALEVLIAVIFSNSLIVIPSGYVECD